MEMSKHSQNKMQVVVRPEIRKGCIWVLQLKFAEEVCNLMNEFSLVNDFSGKTPFLCLTVRSKLLKTELPFSKVAQILNDDTMVTIKANACNLNVKFTSRPRTAFHRHSDVMILLAVVKKGEQIICSDEVELIFRGGTGSVHSADSKKDLPGGYKMDPYHDSVGKIKGEHQDHFFPP